MRLSAWTVLNNLVLFPLLQMLPLCQKILDRFESVERHGYRRCDLDDVRHEPSTNCQNCPKLFVTHYMPFQNPSSTMIRLIASRAPEYCGPVLDNPATCSFRLNTSNGWVNRSAVPPAKAPQRSFFTARSASDTDGSWIRSEGRTYDFTSLDQLRLLLAMKRLTALVEVKVERDLVIGKPSDHLDSSSCSPYGATPTAVAQHPRLK